MTTDPTLRIVTEKLITAYEQLLQSGKSTERKQALRKLIEIAQSCPLDDLASRAHKLIVSFKST